MKIQERLVIFHWPFDKTNPDKLLSLAAFLIPGHRQKSVAAVEIKVVKP
jgi:hypothetical protein